MATLSSGAAVCDPPPLILNASRRGRRDACQRTEPSVLRPEGLPGGESQVAGRTPQREGQRRRATREPRDATRRSAFHATRYDNNFSFESGLFRWGECSPLHRDRTRARLYSTIVNAVDRQRGGLLAYLLKKPGNFVQHFLETCHRSRPLYGVDLHQYHMERVPKPKKIEKKVGVAKSTSTLLKSHFFLVAAC